MRLVAEVRQNKLQDKVIVITGGAGLLGQEHAKAVLSEGGIAVLLNGYRHRGASRCPRV